MRLLSVRLLGLSVSIDALLAAVAYGITGIRVPGYALWLLGVVAVREGLGRWAVATPHASGSIP
jgi:putative Mn2+ efflux pump MntP